MLVKDRYLFAGEIFVPRGPAVVTTVLGSCVAVCLWDPVRGAGGINHFKSPRWEGWGPRTNMYGDISIPALVRRMLARGSRRGDLKARIYGGGGVIGIEYARISVCEANIAVAREMLRAEGIPIVRGDVGGSHGRKLRFFTADGRVTVKKVESLSRLVCPTDKA